MGNASRASVDQRASRQRSPSNHYLPAYQYESADDQYMDGYLISVDQTAPDRIGADREQAEFDRPTGRSGILRFIGIAFLTVALLQFGFRGMQRVRSEVPMWDFASVYAAARTWIHGGNPYDVRQVITTWRAAGAFADRDVSYFATVYPPSSLILLVPFAPLPAPLAMAAWLLVTAALLILQFAALIDMAKLQWRDPRTLILIGAALASAPYQFGLLSGQLSMPAISACIIAFWCASAGRDGLAGVLLGVACALKPQIAGPFVAYYLLLRHWKVATFAGVFGGVIGITALVAMRVSHIDWINGWTQSIAATQQIGGVNDYGWAGEFRDEIVDLKMLLVSLIHDPRTLRIAVELIVMTLAGCYVWAFPKHEPSRMRVGNRRELLLLAGLSAIVLLPVYHRIYDVALLTTALAWALAELTGPFRKRAIALMVPMAIFLIPFDGVEAFARRVPRLSNASKTGLWQSIIAPHYAWALLALTVSLLAIVGFGSKRSAAAH